MTTQIVIAPSEDEVLAKTQRMRMAILDSMIKDGVPDNNRDRRVLLELANGADTTALALKRMDQDKKQGAEDNAVALMTAAILKGAAATNPFLKTDSVVRHELTSLPEGMVDVGNIVDGELDIGLSALTHEQFMEEGGMVEED